MSLTTQQQDPPAHQVDHPLHIPPEMEGKLPCGLHPAVTAAGVHLLSAIIWIP